jgi:catalase
MGNCTDKEIVKRQITIFREVSPDIAERLEAKLGVKGEQTIEGIVFNGTHNGFGKKKGANGMPIDEATVNFDNGAPRSTKA